jgi:hypothetical protein
MSTFSGSNSHQRRYQQQTLRAVETKWRVTGVQVNNGYKHPNTPGYQMNMLSEQVTMYSMLYAIKGTLMLSDSTTK